MMTYDPNEVLKPTGWILSQKGLPRGYRSDLTEILSLGGDSRFFFPRRYSVKVYRISVKAVLGKRPRESV